MNTTGNKAKDVAQRIAEAILAEDILNKTTLIPKLTSIIKVWIKENDKPSDYNNITTEKGKLVRTIEQKNIEIEFWKNGLKKYLVTDGMLPYYDDLNNVLKEKGYRK